MFECQGCGFMCGNQIAYREHRRTCMSYEAPKPEPVDDDASPMNFDAWLADHADD